MRIFIDEIYGKSPLRNYPTNKFLYNHFDVIWSFGLADFSDCKTSNNKGIRYIFVTFHKFSKYLWAKPPKKNSQTKTQKFSNIPTTSKRSPVKLENDRGAEFFIIVISKFFYEVKMYHII